MSPKQDYAKLWTGRANRNLALHRDFLIDVPASFPAHRQFRVVLFIAFCWGISGAIAGAQQFPPAEAKARVAPTSVPLSEIASQAESTLRSVQSIGTTLSADPITETVEKRLRPLTYEIELRGAEMAKFLVGIVPLELLHSMEIVLQRYGDQLSSWNRDLTVRIKTLDSQIAQLDRLSNIWKATLQLPEQSLAAPEMLKRAQSLIDLIDRTQQAAESLRERDLIMQGQVLEATARLQAIAPAFEQAQAYVTENLFVQNSQPLWRLAMTNWRKERQASLIPPASAALLKAYVSREPAVLYLHAVVIVFLSVSFYCLRRRVHKWIVEEPSLQRVASVFDLPVSTAITLSFLLFGSIYSMAPFLLRAILWGVLLISITLILRRLVDRALFPMLNALVALYFIDQLRLLTVLLPLVGRLVFAAEILGGTLFLIWFMQLKHLPAIGAAFALSRFLRFLLEEDIYYHWHLARGIPQAISTMVHYAFLLTGFFVGLAVLGVDLTKITILAGAFTVGVGFGLQTVINNFVCGLLLLFERPIKIGDIIQIDKEIGEVRRIGIRACVIRTTDGSEVIVPNGTIIANNVTNWTLSDRYRAIEVPVTVARGAAPQHVIEVLKHVAANQPGIANEPAPQAYVVSFVSTAVSFNLRGWTDQYEDWIQVRSDLAVAIDEALIRENIAVA